MMEWFIFKVENRDCAFAPCSPPAVSQHLGECGQMFRCYQMYSRFCPASSVPLQEHAFTVVGMLVKCSAFYSYCFIIKYLMLFVWEQKFHYLAEQRQNASLVSTGHELTSTLKPSMHASSWWKPSLLSFVSWNAEIAHVTAMFYWSCA